MHADTQGQSFPVFALAHLLGFDLMPRIRNWQDLVFYRPTKQTEYVHIDALFGESGRNVIAFDFDLIESQFRHLMRVAISVREWIGFGNGGVITDNDLVEQEKTAKFNALLTNAVIFHNALDIAEIVRRLQEEGHVIAPEDLAHISPCLTEHIRRFGEYSTHELVLEPEAYDPHLDVDFSCVTTVRPPRTASARRHDQEKPGGNASGMPAMSSVTNFADSSRAAGRAALMPRVAAARPTPRRTRCLPGPA
ncbi:Tn3 family transposase [Streptomyces sp. NPDC017890]|uniref:Tn3 family transposase n=1 Tax=Streptomyces sp. NPDC017890 TaxID=3365015 RepID=UPI0037AED46A